MSTIDTLFIATNFEEVDMEDNPDKYLCRYEFYEILVRIAIEKYYKSKTCKTMAEAVGRLLVSNVFKHSNFVVSWHKWRDEHLWTIQIDDLYKANLTSLKTLFSVRFSTLFYIDVAPASVTYHHDWRHDHLLPKLGFDYFYQENQTGFFPLQNDYFGWNGRQW